tara:strand:- start:238 stop:750 length:513 start_codon:yes stop_codon:yes gene_type:complete
MPRKVYRHRLSANIVEIVTDFARIHEHDDRKDYKQAWLEWVELNKSIFDEECTRLKDLGYEGDPLDKIFKAGRYYFRKKSLAKKSVPKVRRVYIGTSREMLQAMDAFISSQLNADNPLSPAACYLKFVESEKGAPIYEAEVTMLATHLDSPSARDKLKKTFKNRYYRQVR